MYTVEDEKRDLFEDELDDAVYYENRRGIIFKVIIIILCIIVLIWLIKALRTNNNTGTGATHDANVLKMRLASEKYFFLSGNKDKSYVDLSTLKSKGLIGDVVDARNKVCNEKQSTTKLVKEAGSYKMTVALSCSTNDKEEVFYYHGNTLACLNCHGKETNMNGKNVIAYNEPEKKEDKEVDTHVDDDIPDDYGEYNKYSCINWTDWSKERVFDASLTERSKTLVLGVKKGTGTKETVYGEWSSYSTTPVVGNENLEVETKVDSYQTWSANKTTTKPIKESSKIRIISKTDNRKEIVGNLTTSEFVSGRYEIKNGYCEGMDTIKDKNGKYALTYINCRYVVKDGSSTGDVTYTYQELETRSTTYYRYRTIQVIDNTVPDVYTTEKYEESNLPAGYVKVDGSEETYYSYKLTYCEK